MDDNKKLSVSTDDYSINLQELTNSIEEIVSTPDIYIFFTAPSDKALIASNEICREITNNKIEFLSQSESDGQIGELKSDKITVPDLRQVIRCPITDIEMDKNEEILSSSNYMSQEEHQSGNVTQGALSNDDYSFFINLYCSQCNDVSSNYFDRKCFHCQTDLLFQCASCLHIYKRLASIQNHIKYECSREIIYKCFKCDYKTIQKVKLINHIKISHPTLVAPQTIYRCSTCHKKFRNQENKINHEKACGTEKLLHCKYCLFKTKFSSGLKIHTQIKHQEFISQNYKCYTCGKTYKTLQYLNKHIKMTCGINQKFQCDHCDREFERKYALAKHIQLNHSYIFYKKKIALNLLERYGEMGQN